MTSAEFEKTVRGDEQVEKLWKAFEVFDQDGNATISAKELGQVMRSLGQSPTDTELADTIEEADVDSSGTIDFEELKAVMVSEQGDRKSDLELAFSMFDENGNGQITASEMRSVMSFGLTDEELDEMVKEVDHDGDGSIDFQEFCKLMPDESETTANSNSTAAATNSTVAVRKSTAPNTTSSTPEQASPDRDSELARLKELLAKHPNSEQRGGTSRREMQIGMFRLLQGAAYRCFRESFCANHHTHLRVRNLPYTIADFVQFVKAAIALYKQLGVVEEACYPVLDAVVESITDEYTRLQERIKNWKTVEKTLEMLAEEKAMLEARGKSATVKQKFAAGVEMAIALKKKRFSLRDIASGVLAMNELNELRNMEIDAELAPPPAKSEGDPHEYLKKWNRIILSNASEEVDGAMMPVAYWYEEFMPSLLAAFSVSTKADIQSNTVPDAAALDKWYLATKKAGEFDRYGIDVAEGFPNCTPKQKLMLKQAWCLTHHYLNGVQKRRERLEVGRESGALSQYVAFIDVYIGRSDVKNAQMRVSFPYYLGPAVWRFFHTTAEIVCTKTDVQQKALVAVFKDFFQMLASMYPCPYCRHHLNMYVLQNKEVEMYPVEYLLLGRDLHLTNFEVSLDAKLSTVVDGPSLRLFLWKLHNTVSSSIERSEEWYHKDEQAFYTTRYWPSFDSELERAKALGHNSISTDCIYRLYNILKPASRLAGVRTTLQKLLEKGDEEGIKEACLIAQDYIKDLEEAVIGGQFLQESYRFDPNLVDKTPHFTPEEEELARSGVFTDVTLISAGASATPQP